jgi:hypothetical protein
MDNKKMAKSGKEYRDKNNRPPRVDKWQKQAMMCQRLYGETKYAVGRGKKKDKERYDGDE